MTQTISFYEDGKPLITGIKSRILAAMESACTFHDIDRDNMANCVDNLIRSEEAREWFTEWTGIEVVLNIAETEI